MRTLCVSYIESGSFVHSSAFSLLSTSRGISSFFFHLYNRGSIEFDLRMRMKHYLMIEGFETPIIFLFAHLSRTGIFILPSFSRHSHN